MFVERRLTCRVCTPPLTVRVPLPSQASLARNILLSVTKSTVYTPSGSTRMVSSSGSVSAAVVTGTVASVTCAVVGAAVWAGSAAAPQPASSRQASNPEISFLILFILRSPIP